MDRPDYPYHPDRPFCPDCPYCPDRPDPPQPIWPSWPPWPPWTWSWPWLKGVFKVVWAVLHSWKYPWKHVICLFVLFWGQSTFASKVVNLNLPAADRLCASSKWWGVKSRARNTAQEAWFSHVWFQLFLMCFFLVNLNLPEAGCPLCLLLYHPAASWEDTCGLIGWKRGKYLISIGLKNI